MLATRSTRPRERPLDRPRRHHQSELGSQVCVASHVCSVPARRATNRTIPPIGEVILGGMTHRVGPKGQVVIPKELRDQLGIEPGDEVDFWFENGHVAVRLAEHRRPLRGRFARSALTLELERERAADRAREDLR